MESDTQELVNRFAQGDQAAFTELYHSLYHSILFRARSIVSLEQAEEATADAFYKLWKQRKQFNHIGSIKKWLFVTTTNRAINMLKEAGVLQKKHQELAYLDNGKTLTTHFRDQVEFDVFNKISLEIENLASRQKEVLKLYYLQRMTIAEIAAALSISEITVKQTKARALQLIRLRVSAEDMLALAVFFSGMVSP